MTYREPAITERELAPEEVARALAEFIAKRDGRVFSSCTVEWTTFAKDPNRGGAVVRVEWDR